MTPSDLLQFMRLHRWAVEASVASAARPQAAVIGVAVTEAFEVVFDTLETSRKAQNLRQNPHVAFVLGGLAGEERTVQDQGVVDEPHGAERDRITHAYLEVFPDGRERQQWLGLIYLRAKPAWIRYSDFTRTPPLVIEFSADDLSRR